MIKAASYMDIAEIIGRNSYCKRHQVGAVIVRDGNIIAFGYNGTPSGFPNQCEDEEGRTMPEVLHAESNAIAKLARSVESSEGATLYTTMAPCLECAKLIIQAGISLVVYRDEYRNTDGIGLLTFAGIQIAHITELV